MSSGPDWVGLFGYREGLILFLSGCLQCFSQQREWNQGITFIQDPAFLVPKKKKQQVSQSSHKTQQSGKAARYCQQKLRVIWYKHWARNGTLFPSSHLRILIMGLFLLLRTKQELGSFSSSSLPGQGCCHFHGEEICLDHLESGSWFAVSSHQFSRYLIWIFL